MEALQQLTHLDVSNNQLLDLYLPNPSVTYLDCSGNFNITSPKMYQGKRTGLHISALVNLRVLDMTNVRNMREPFSFTGLNSLEEVYMSGMYNMTDAQVLATVNTLPNRNGRTLGRVTVSNVSDQTILNQIYSNSDAKNWYAWHTWVNY